MVFSLSHVFNFSFYHVKKAGSCLCILHFITCKLFGAKVPRFCLTFRQF